MTNEAEIAKRASYKFECKKDGLKQNQDGGIKVVFTIHPNDMPQALYSDEMGQRYVAVLVPLNEDETPRLAPASSAPAEVKGNTDALVTPSSSAQGGDKPKNYTAAAKLLALDLNFRKYAARNYPGIFVLDLSMGEEHIEKYCGVTSCKDIKDGTEAGKKFARLYAEFQEWERFL